MGTGASQPAGRVRFVVVRARPSWRRRLLAFLRRYLPW
jgi:hypothetical protein